MVKIHITCRIKLIDNLHFCLKSNYLSKATLSRNVDNNVVNVVHYLLIAYLLFNRIAIKIEYVLSMEESSKSTWI